MNVIIFEIGALYLFIFILSLAKSQNLTSPEKLDCTPLLIGQTPFFKYLNFYLKKLGLSPSAITLAPKSPTNFFSSKCILPFLQLFISIQFKNLFIVSARGCCLQSGSGHLFFLTLKVLFFQVGVTSKFSILMKSIYFYFI